MAMSRSLLRLFGSCVTGRCHAVTTNAHALCSSTRWLSGMATNRDLLSPAWLKIHSYVKTRETTMETSMVDIRNAFTTRMEEHLADGDNAVSTADLRWILYTAQSDEDLDLAVRMFTRFQQTRNKSDDPSFRFDPIIMRLCHLLQKPDLAYQLITDEMTSDAIQTDSAFVTAMDLFYKLQQYDRLLEVMAVHTAWATRAERPIAWGCLFLTYATYWQQNTAESYASSKELWARNRKSEFPGSPRAVSLAVHMALKNNEPDVAAKYLQTVTNKSILTTSLKVMTLTALAKEEQAVDVLRSLLPDGSSDKRHYISKEAVDPLVAMINTGDNQDLKDTMPALMRQMEFNNCFHNKPVEELLLQTLAPAGSRRSPTVRATSS